jgi:hypothetical protein
MFLGLPDPNPSVKGMDPDPESPRILPSSRKGVERTEIMLANKISATKLYF